ncbi:MAG: transglycosylase SLT domain-containing protein [Candidatus Acidiferrales bacterium]
MRFFGPVIRGIAVLFVFSVVVCLPAAFAAPQSAPAPSQKTPSHHAKKSTAVPATRPSATPAAKQLEELSRALKKKNPAVAYAKLSALAMRKPSGALGARAALALGYYDYGKEHYAQSAKWLKIAQGDPLLRDYALYWSAQTNLALNHNAEALAQLEEFRKDYPDSVITDEVLQSLGVAALALGKPQEILTALDAYPPAREKPALLFLRAEAREQSAQLLQAAGDYQTIYLRFPLDEQAREAGEKLAFLRSSLGDKLPAIPVEQQIEHASTIFMSHQWGDARSEYSHLLPQLTGADRERAELRILECGVALGAGVSEISALSITDPDVDAERYYSIANYYRDRPSEAQMVAAVESAVARAPDSRWSESALFLAGNYYWVMLERDRAATYYKRLSDNFPSSAEALPAQWRYTWAAVLKREPEAPADLAEHLRRFPGSQFSPDALYWLGRLSEEAGNSALARTYYTKLQERFPENYFQAAAAKRLRALGPGPAADADVLATIPPVLPALTLGPTIPAAAAGRQARADALRSIAFDASAELELRAAFAATREPRLLLEAAQEAVNAGHVGAAIVTVRQIYPQLEWRPFNEVPREVWLTAYAMPFESSIVTRSSSAGVDPMLTAGLIRQESAYDPEARSHANAFGLMQLLPKTARRFAKQAKVRYSTPMLFEPDYNIRIGTIYFAGLQRNFGNVESALAAYNAGEDRVSFWTAGQTYREPAEFVDSIPFTETRDYVEIVTRNADIYRRLYGRKLDEPQSARGPKNESFTAAARRGH